MIYGAKHSPLGGGLGDLGGPLDISAPGCFFGHITGFFTS